jgi:hypothetical protein
MTADGTSFSTAMSALANDRAVTTRAPAPANASAMPNAIKGSSSQTRIERPAKLVLFMLVSRGAAKRQTARGRSDLLWAARCLELSINPQWRNKRDDRLPKALIA